MFILDQSYEHYLDFFRLDNVLFVHTWSILWTLFGLVQTRKCCVCSHLIDPVNIILTCSDWTMFYLFTLDQSYEHCLDLFRLANVLFVHPWSILWTLFGLVQTRQCFVCSDFGWFYEHYFDFVPSYALPICHVIYKQ